jgi:hypothetical protein
VKSYQLNTFAPGSPHATQQQVLDTLDKGQRFVMLRAGRKWRKTSLIISWLFEKALSTGLVCPYIAPSRKQAKDIVWNDHIVRMIDELKRNKVPYKTNETELSVEISGRGKVQLHGVENKDSLRGISNWGAVGMDEYDDWEEDIWPTIIRPNLITHEAPCIIGGTPKGFRNMYRIEANSAVNKFKCFHFRTHDNPDISPDELASIEREYMDMGMGYYRQEILAEYEKPYGVVYEDWPLSNFGKMIPYDPHLPLYISMDFGVNDPTAIIWVQRFQGEYRVIDYFEESNGDVAYFSQVIKSKPYKTAELICGDPAGKARSIVTNTSPIDEYRKLGIFIRYVDGVKIPDQIRITHKYMRGIFVDCHLERFRECLLNYRYPTKKETQVNQSNEIPVHDQWSHGMRALEYLFVNLDVFNPSSHSDARPTFIPQDSVIGV